MIITISLIIGVLVIVLTVLSISHRELIKKHEILFLLITTILGAFIGIFYGSWVNNIVAEQEADKKINDMLDKAVYECDIQYDLLNHVYTLSAFDYLSAKNNGTAPTVSHNKPNVFPALELIETISTEEYYIRQISACTLKFLSIANINKKNLLMELDKYEITIYSFEEALRNYLNLITSTKQILLNEIKARKGLLHENELEDRDEADWKTLDAMNQKDIRYFINKDFKNDSLRLKVFPE